MHVKDTLFVLEYMVDITTLLYKDKKNVSEVNTIIQVKKITFHILLIFK